VFHFSGPATDKLDRKHGVVGWQNENGIQKNVFCKLDAAAVLGAELLSLLPLPVALNRISFIYGNL